MNHSKHSISNSCDLLKLRPFGFPPGLHRMVKTSTLCKSFNQFHLSAQQFRNLDWYAVLWLVQRLANGIIFHHTVLWQSGPFHLHNDFLKSRSWEIKVLRNQGLFQTLEKLQVLETFFLGLHPEKSWVLYSKPKKIRCQTWKN